MVAAGCMEKVFSIGGGKAGDASTTSRQNSDHDNYINLMTTLCIFRPVIADEFDSIDMDEDCIGQSLSSVLEVNILLE